MIKEIKIGGKLRPVKFGWNAYAIFGDITGISIDKMVDFAEMKISDVMALIFAGLKEGARYKKQEFEHTIEDIGDWMDEDQSVIEDFMKAFTESQPGQEKNLRALNNKKPGQKRK